MRIGLLAGDGGGNLDQAIKDIQRAEEQGFASAWMANIFGLDAINALGLAGRETTRIELGTAVVPTFPRHPMAIAQQALTSQAACKGRFVLGIGLSHKIVIENMMGLSYEHPAAHMREYLEVLMPLVRGEPVQHKGDLYRVQAGLQVSGVQPPPVLVAALGPAMLRLAGRLADGTITWMTGPKTLAGHTVPEITKAAAAAGKPAPRIVAGFPIALTSDPDKAREVANQTFQMYGTLPSYRAMLDREGAPNPADIAIVGNEKALDEGIKRLEEAGVTDFGAGPFNAEGGAVPRTVEYLRSKL
jgi:5,10-methylenetetrahydromethanopterin reductase